MLNKLQILVSPYIFRLTSRYLSEKISFTYSTYKPSLCYMLTPCFCNNQFDAKHGVLNTPMYALHSPCSLSKLDFMQIAVLVVPSKARTYSLCFQPEFIKTGSVKSSIHSADYLFTTLEVHFIQLRPLDNHIYIVNLFCSFVILDLMQIGASIVGYWFYSFFEPRFAQIKVLDNLI